MPFPNSGNENSIFRNLGPKTGSENDLPTGRYVKDQTGKEIFLTNAQLDILRKCSLEGKMYGGLIGCCVGVAITRFLLYNKVLRPSRLLPLRFAVSGFAGAMVGSYVGFSKMCKDPVRRVTAELLAVDSPAFSKRKDLPTDSAASLLSMDDTLTTNEPSDPRAVVSRPHMQFAPTSPVRDWKRPYSNNEKVPVEFVLVPNGTWLCRTIFREQRLELKRATDEARREGGYPGALAGALSFVVMKRTGFLSPRATIGSGIVLSIGGYIFGMSMAYIPKFKLLREKFAKEYESSTHRNAPPADYSLLNRQLDKLRSDTPGSGVSPYDQKELTMDFSYQDIKNHGTGLGNLSNEPLQNEDSAALTYDERRRLNRFGAGGRSSGRQPRVELSNNDQTRDGPGQYRAQASEHNDILPLDLERGLPTRRAPLGERANTYGDQGFS